jgi:hypothetical protein
MGHVARPLLLLLELLLLELLLQELLLLLRPLPAKCNQPLPQSAPRNL